MVWSVRSRITLMAAAVVLIVLGVTGAALVAAQRAVLTDNVDEVLERHAAAISVQIDNGTIPRRLAGQGDEEAFARVVDSSGHVIASTVTSFNGLIDEVPDMAGPRFETVRSRAGDGAFRVMLQPHGDVVIVTGTPLDDVAESEEALTRGLIVAVPAASLLLGVLVWVLVGRVLSPVERIRAEVSEISGSSLDRRVPEPGTRDEIDRLAHTMNAMLARVETASDRQRRFVADASHELRTPLTRMRAELEVDLAHPESADPASTHRRLVDDTRTLQRLVDDLLILASIDDTGIPGRRVPIDLDDIVLDEVQRLGAPIDVSGVSGAQVSGDPAQLERVVRNLLDNAVRYGGPTVAISLQEEDGEAVLTVTDDGPGIPTALRERVFERFARVDEARAASDGGTGLGLAITRELVTAHGGTIVIDSAHSPGARFVVRLPLSS